MPEFVHNNKIRDHTHAPSTNWWQSTIVNDETHSLNDIVSNYMFVEVYICAVRSVY